MKYRKRPLEVEAIQWTGENFDDIWGFGGGSPDDACDESANPRIFQWGTGWDDELNQIPLNLRKLSIHTPEGDMVAHTGDWIIKGIRGELYPCKDDIFRESYAPVEESALAS